MDRFHLMSVYVAVAEEEGFSRAARRLVAQNPRNPQGSRYHRKAKRAP